MRSPLMTAMMTAALLALLALVLPVRGAPAAAWDGTVKCYLAFFNMTSAKSGGYIERCTPDPAPFRALAPSTHALDK
jgi:hypothetical protein